MKKLILSVSLVVLSLNGYAQTAGFGSSPGTFDTSNSPSGVGFSGAMGGANNTTTPSQGTTTNPNSTVSPAPGATSTPAVPSAQLPQQQQEGNFAGGAMGGSGQNLPQNSTVPQTQPRSNNIPAATGVGTGAPTTY